MNEDLAKKLKYLRMGDLLTHWDDNLKLASHKRYSHARLLTHVIEQEYPLAKRLRPQQHDWNDLLRSQKQTINSSSVQ